MSKCSSGQVRAEKGIPPLLRHAGATADTVAADPWNVAGTSLAGQVGPDPSRPGLPLPVELLMRDWESLRKALEQASLAVHAMTCDVSIRIRACVNPMCVYRVGLLDRTGGSVPDAHV